MVVRFGVAHRHPELARATPELPREVARHHPHHCEVLAVNPDRATHQRPIAAIAVLPEAVAQNHFMVVAWNFFLGQKGAPEKRLHAQHRKEAGGHAQSGDLLRLLLGSRRGKIVAAPGGIKDGHALERMALSLKVPEVRRGDDVPVVGPLAERFPHQHEAVRVWKWQPPQEGGVDRAEDGRIGAHTQRERQDSHRREAGVLR